MCCHHTFLVEKCIQCPKAELCFHMHYENTPIQIHGKFYHQKMAIFQKKNSEIFHISAQNID